MDTTSIHQLTPASSSFSMDTTRNPSSSSSSPPSRWDVFLSFRGKDTRANFIAHLYKALDQAGILTFRDDPALEKGEQISPALLKAIKDSNKFVVVLSENYAYSSWCLNELVEILSCKRINGQVVIPVYYYVNPSDVRYQKASFGEALDVHKNTKRYSDDMMDKWKSALAEIGEISGYHLSKDANENEADTIQKIVEDVALPKVLHLEEYVFGIDSAVEVIHLKLKMESNDVRAIVIWGMGGIGKTTTAKAFFNKYSNKFDINCFIENAKQYSLLSLLEQLLIELLKKKDYKVSNVEMGIRELQQILPSKKALIILDDLEQLELLVKLRNLFSNGSRIIVTARNASLQNKLKVDISKVDAYEVKGLGEIESLELFSYHAFRKTVPPESFKELSKGFVSYAGGLPLALKVFGSSLRSRTEESFWEAQLEIVRKFPENEIQSVLQVGYDGLDNQTQKDIFLDIAFFFVGKDKDEAFHVFKSCGLLPDAGIPILVERCLLTIDKNNKFQMHNLIQDMGMELGKSRCLFWRGNEWEDLQNHKGTSKIEGVIIDLTMSTERQISAKIFERLPNLRLLQIIGAHDIKGNYKNLFRELRCIRWPKCPWTRLPSDFRPRKLVSLDMSSSNLKILWKGTILWKDVMPLVSLKTIDLSYSENLKTTPDFRDIKLVEKLVFTDCESLVEVHSSIGQLTNLGHLDLSRCASLKRLPEQLGDMKGLKILNARRCGNLEQLPDSIGHLKKLVKLKLDMCWKLNKLPEQLGDMEGLRKLDVSDTPIEQLPDSIVHLKELVKLKLKRCTKLNKLPEQLGDMEGLRKLHVSWSAIEQLPDSIVHLKELVKLKLDYCKKLNKLPEQLGDMEGLRKLHVSCSGIEKLPDSIGLLSSLQELDLSHTPIEQLPNSIGRLTNLVHLGLSSCKKLTSLPNSICKLKLLKELDLWGCYELERLPEQLGDMEGLRKLDVSHTPIEQLPDSIGRLINLVYLNMSYCYKLTSLPNSICKLKLLKVLNLEDCYELERLPEQLGKMQSLQYLYLIGCRKLEYLPDSIGLLSSSLQKLDLYKCEKLEYLPDSIGLLSSLQELDLSHTLIEQLPDSIVHLKELVKLKLKRCMNLNKLPEQLGKMQSLQCLYLNECSKLEYLPDSIGLLTRLQELELYGCEKLEYLPDSIRLLSSLLNVTSFQHFDIGNSKFREI